MKDHGRGNQIGTALDVLEWVESHTLFTRHELAEAFGVHPRTALRWLQSLLARDRVEVVEEGVGFLAARHEGNGHPRTVYRPTRPREARSAVRALPHPDHFRF